MSIITVAAIKGGTGKTTTAAALAQAAAADGQRVLAIDLDPQANLTFSLGATAAHAGSYHLLSGSPAAETIQSTEQGIDVIAANTNLAALTKVKAYRLKDAIQPIEEAYSLIVIDTPPTMGDAQRNALTASSGLLVPLETDIFSLQGLYQIVDLAKEMQAQNPALEILGVMLTRFNSRPNISRYVRDVIKGKADELGIPYLGEIRPSVAVTEAAAMQQSLFDYAPTSKPAADYKAIYDQIKEK